jgi:hypothetical protein
MKDHVLRVHLPNYFDLRAPYRMRERLRLIDFFLEELVCVYGQKDLEGLYNYCLRLGYTPFCRTPQGYPIHDSEAALILRYSKWQCVTTTPMKVAPPSSPMMFVHWRVVACVVEGLNANRSRAIKIFPVGHPRAHPIQLPVYGGVELEVVASDNEHTYL